ncbi:hypothetical protein NMY22_g17802 [Coprinellus aureogranulatus]|nr:hypothetical protein NMY22_g17802 [Coprinellus aureogranulatus]
MVRHRTGSRVNPFSSPCYATPGELNLWLEDGVLCSFSDMVRDVFTELKRRSLFGLFHPGTPMQNEAKQRITSPTCLHQNHTSRSQVLTDPEVATLYGHGTGGVNAGTALLSRKYRQFEFLRLILISNRYSLESRGPGLFRIAYRTRIAGAMTSLLALPVLMSHLPGQRPSDIEGRRL